MEPIKPQDIVVLLKVLLKGKGRWKYEDLEKELGLSKSVIYRSLNRCAGAKFISNSPFEYFFAGNVKEFLLHGIQYAFATTPGKMSKGIPTGHSAPVLNSQIIADKDHYVWPSVKGKSRGQSIKPLDERVPDFILSDIELYDLLALIDAIRVGKVREKELAGNLLTAKIDSYALRYK